MSVSTVSNAGERQSSYHPFQCLVCQRRFTRHENLKRHAVLHSRSQDEDVLSCTICQATFSRADLRHRHMKRKHPELEAKRTSKEPQREQQDNPPATNEIRSEGQTLSSLSPVDSHSGSHIHYAGNNGEMEVDGEIWQAALRYVQGCLEQDHQESSSLETRAHSGTGENGRQIITSPMTQQSSVGGLTCNDYLFHNGTDLEPNLLLGATSNESDAGFDIQISPRTTSQITPNLSSSNFDLGIPGILLPIHPPQIEDDWLPSVSRTARGCDLFFTHVSHFVPFIHQPTHDIAQIASPLLFSMLCLGFQHGEDPDCDDEPGSGASLSLQCFRRARVLITSEEDIAGDTTRSIPMVQGYLLLQIYAMLYLCGEDSSYGLKTHSKMISLARAGGLMQPIAIESATPQDLDSLWRQFIRAESHKRTAFALHQIDSLWYQFLSIPRSISHLEIKHDLPCPADYWKASSSVEWAHRQLVTRHPDPAMRYPEAIRRFLSPDADLRSLPPFDPYGAINITQFLVSSAREISGWSTMTGMVSIERLEPLSSSLVALSPFIRSSQSAARTPDAILCEATWETAMIELHLWSPSHTGGIVQGSIDAVLQQLTYLTPFCETNTAKAIQPHIDWFLRYLDATHTPDSEAPWVTLYAYKAFMIAWQLVRAGISGSMQVVGVQDGDLEEALRWTRNVFRRRERWQLGKIIMKCLDTLES